MLKMGLISKIKLIKRDRRREFKSIPLNSIEYLLY